MGGMGERGACNPANDIAVIWRGSIKPRLRFWFFYVLFVSKDNLYKFDLTPLQYRDQT